MSALRLTTAERLVKRHGGTYGHGTFDSATGLTEEKAKALHVELVAANYQVIRPPFKLAKSDRWQVIFR